MHREVLNITVVFLWKALELRRS